MYELLKNIAATNSWGFTYARQDFQNLHNEVEEDGVPNIFLDPVQTDKSFGEYNEVESKTYTGSFMILISSDIDDSDYEQRYIDYMKPIIDTTMGTINSTLQCNNDVTINSWRETEVVNVFDYNMDGIIVNYTIVEDV